MVIVTFFDNPMANSRVEVRQHADSDRIVVTDSGALQVCSRSLVVFAYASGKWLTAEVTD